MFLDDIKRTREALAHLVEDPGGNGNISFRHEDGSYAMYLGNNGYGSHLIRVPLSNREEKYSKHITQSLNISVAEGILDGNYTYYLEVSCVDKLLTETFDRLALELIEKIFDNPNKRSEKLLRESLDSWKLLLGKRKNVDDASSVGLWGELYTLKILARQSPKNALDLWTGPDKHRHDFVSKNRDFEVKTTQKIASTLLTLSGIHQLREIQNVPLTLIRVSIVEHASGQTLSDLIDEIVELGVNQIDLYEKIRDVIGEEIIDYSEKSYALTDIKFYLVDANFPKLPGFEESSDLPRGIRQLQYVVDLNFATEISNQEFDGQIAKMLGE